MGRLGFTAPSLTRQGRREDNFLEMAAEKTHNPAKIGLTSISDYAGCFDAPLRIGDLSEIGMVFRLRRFMQVGTQLALGLHVCGDARGCGERSPNRFLAVQGFVVDCHMVSEGPDDHDYDVTLLFDCLSDGDRRFLRGVKLEAGGAASGGGNPVDGPGDGDRWVFGPN